MPSNNPVLAMLSYAFLLIAAGVLAYLHLLPSDLLVATFYLVAGHAGANLPATFAPFAPTASATTPAQKPAGGENAPAY